MVRNNLSDKLCWDIYVQFRDPFGLECMEIEIAVDWLTEVIAGTTNFDDWGRNFLMVETVSLVDPADILQQDTEASKQ